MSSLWLLAVSSLTLIASCTAALRAADYRVVPVGAMNRVGSKSADFKAPSDAAAMLWSARNEHEAVQLVILTEQAPLRDVVLSCSDLQQINGSGIIASENITWFVVGFVDDNSAHKVPVELTNGMLDATRLSAWPDPLHRKSSFCVDADAAQPIWIDVFTHEQTPAGVYRGNIRITPQGAPATEVQLIVHVWDFTLPRENHLPNLFYLWERGLSESSGLDQRDPAFQELRRKYIEAYLDHRISPAAPSYYPLNIRQTLEDDGSISTDWSKFDADLTFAFERGQTAFLWPGSWNIGMEPKNAGYFATPFVWSAKSQQYVWPDFMKDWDHRTPGDSQRILAEYSRMAEHLQAKGWLEHSVAYLAGEPHKGHKSHVPTMDDFDFTNQVFKWVHRVNPRLKTMVTLNADPFSPEISADVDIWAIDSTVLVGHEQREQAERARGREVWTYFPGLYRTDALPAAYRIGPWFCWRYDMDGFGPFTDLTAWFAYEAFPNTCVLYPGIDGPVTSIRFELLRDGMEDYEYFWRLDDLANKIRKSQPRSPLLAKAAQLLADRRVIRDKDPLKAGNWDFSGDSILAVRREIGDLCQQLSRAKVP